MYEPKLRDVDAGRQLALSVHAIGRLSTPDDIANGIVFSPPTMPALSPASGSWSAAGRRHSECGDGG